MPRAISWLLDSNEPECIILAALFWRRMRNPRVHKLESAGREGVLYRLNNNGILSIRGNDHRFICTWDPDGYRVRAFPIHKKVW